MSYTTYINNRTDVIRNCLAELGCQPVIFAGSGLTKRYANGPSWIELLDNVSKLNPRITHNIAYYQQKYGGLLEAGEQLSPEFHTWAWDDGRDKFSEKLFHPNVQRNEFFKYFISEYITNNIPNNLASQPLPSSKNEIELLQKIHPHSIITTNYDLLCELIFPEYTRIVGQKIIRAAGISIGELFKIHGCVTDYKEIVITSSDYKNWNIKKKYLSAKLLTYFFRTPNYNNWVRRSRSKCFSHIA